MNYLLYGPDTYRSRKKLREIIAEYRRKAPTGGLNFHACDAADGDMKTFASAVRGGTLFAEKKLAVLERPFTAPRWIDALPAILSETYNADDVVLVVWDEMLDAEGKKRLKPVERYFDKQQEFLPLQGVALGRWVKEEATARGVALSPADAHAFAAIHGSDLWRMAQEIEKMALGSGVDAGDSRALPRASIFDLGDAFFSSPRDARRILLSLISAGEDEMRVFAYLAGHVRTLLIIKAYTERGIAVPASAKIHPFVVKKASRVIGMLSVDDLARALSRFFEEDRRIKTGVSTAQESLLRLLA